MMNILMIAHEREMNGSSRSLINLLDVFIADGCVVYVLTSFTDGKFVEELKKHQGIILQFPYYRWVKAKPYRKIGKIKQKVLWYLYEQHVNRKSAVKLAEFVQKQGIDILHSNTRVVDIGARIHQYTGIPHIWHFREFGEEDFQMYPVISGKRHFQYIDENTDAVIAVSNAVKEKFRTCIADTIPIYRIYNGVSKANIQKKNPYIPQKIQFLITGRISNAKGQKEVVQAAGILLERGYKTFHINMAGTMEAGYLLWDTETDEVKKRITLLGEVSDMLELRKKMDVELVCSKAEAFGRVTVEAMMSHLPVIGSNRGGTVELIKNGKNGFLYKEGDCCDLADKMQYFLEHKEQVYSFGQCGFDFAKDYFVTERCAEEVRAIYQTLSD